MLVLGIETSCDDTGLALFDSARGLIGHRLHSQLALHAEFGGVVPELASRDHVRRMRPLLDSLLASTGHTLDDLGGVAYTAGPGLVGALLVGATFGRTLAWARGIPAIGVHHLEGHLLTPLMSAPAPSFPFVALLVSGGHTQLFAVTGVGQYALLGESLDDAAGEAFDKTAKLLGLTYPGGPAISALAEHGNPRAYRLPRPMLNRPGLDFSFSGLKTAVRTLVQKATATGAHDPSDAADGSTLPDQVRADIAASLQVAIVDTLVGKCQRALDQTGLDALVVAGGVSANQLLRTRLDAMPAQVYYPALDLCTDNGAMIAHAGCYRLMAGQHDDLAIRAVPRWPLSDLPPVAAS